MEKTEEIKRYLNFQKKLRALRLGEDLGCKYACEVLKSVRPHTTIGKGNSTSMEKRVY